MNGKKIGSSILKSILGVIFMLVMLALCAVLCLAGFEGITEGSSGFGWLMALLLCAAGVGGAGYIVISLFMDPMDTLDRFAVGFTVTAVMGVAALFVYSLVALNTLLALAAWAVVVALFSICVKLNSARKYK